MDLDTSLDGTVAPGAGPGMASDLDLDPERDLGPDLGPDTRPDPGVDAVLARDPEPGADPGGERDAAAEGNLHALLLRMAGSLPDRVLDASREALAAGRRLEVVQAVAFEAISQPLQLDPDEIATLRAELLLGGGDGDLALALEELRGERPPTPWLFLSSLPATPAEAATVVRPLDLTADADEWDPVDRALVAAASAVPGVRAVWRAWRMPSSARPWHDPVRVAVVSVDDEFPDPSALSVHLRQSMLGAGDADAHAEVCWAGLDAPYYQTLARSCGALLWAARPAVPITTARVFDGVDPVRGPWFTTHRPVVGDAAERANLLIALRSGVVIAWSSAAMADILTPERGEVVPLHLRTDGTWVWSEAVGYYLENYGLTPDPELHGYLAGLLAGGERAEPLDEISVHRALVHLYRRRPGEAVWQVPGAGDDPVPAGGDDGAEQAEPANPWLVDAPGQDGPGDGTPGPVLP